MSRTLGESLGVVGEDDAGGHELGEDLEELRVVQHALLHAAVEELVVVRDDLVDRGHGVEALHHRVPVRLQHLKPTMSALSAKRFTSSLIDSVLRRIQARTSNIM